MARKKSRPAAASRSVATPPASTAVVGESAVTGIATTSSRLASRSGGADMRTEKAFLETPVGRFFHRLFKVFSSLQQAITLLTLFTLSLITATLVDSAHGLEIAQQLVYHTWWFILLLVLLGTTILCAALKKMDPKKLAEGRWPWIKHQTGFLVTHVGLLTLVFGGLLTNLGGEDGQIQFIDTGDESIQRKLGQDQTTEVLHMVGAYGIDVYDIDASKSHDERLSRLVRIISSGKEIPDEMRGLLAGSWSLPFFPGHLRWYDEENSRSNMPWYLRTLQFIAEPVRGFSRSVGDGTLTVNNFLPQTELWEYSPARGQESEPAFPALRLRLSSPMMGGQSVPRWVVGKFDAEHDGTPLLCEFFRLYDARLLREFLNPPPVGKMGKDGQLALIVGKGDEVFRFNIDKDQIDKKIKLGDTGLMVQITSVGNLLDEIARDQHHGEKLTVDYPVVKFRLWRGEESAEYLSCARIPSRVIPAERDKEFAEVAAWYHTRDPFWREKHRKGAVQFLQGTDDKVYYRSFGEDGLRGEPEELDVSDRETLHKLPFKMQMSFKIDTYMPRAVEKPQYVSPALQRIRVRTTTEFLPAIRAVLTVKGKEYLFDARLGSTARVFTDGNHLFLIRLRQVTRKLDFQVKLNRAWQVQDPGSTRAAEFHSQFTILPGINGEKGGSGHEVFMNETIDHAGWRFFQANYEATPYVVDNRLASVSGLTLSKDPGLLVKYAGTFIVVLGIAIMFYMRAYFFKPRGSRTVKEPVVALE